MIKTLAWSDPTTQAKISQFEKACWWILFNSCCCLFDGRSQVQYKLKYNKICSWADCGPTVKNLKRIHQFCFADDTTVFVYDLSSHYYFAPHCPAVMRSARAPGREAGSLSLSLSPLAWSLSADFLPSPSSLAHGPIHTGPDHGSAELSIDQTKQEWQFRMLISVTAAALDSHP